MNKIKGYRVMVKMTQEEMAKAIGVALRAYVDKENGKSNFSIEQLKTIKSILNEKGLSIQVDDLI
jgi:putative transcriptional regulator